MVYALPHNLVWNPEAEGLRQGLVFGPLGSIFPLGVTAYDAAGLNHGTLTSMDPPTDWVHDPTLDRIVIDFDGSNDYVALGNPSALQLTSSMTIACWMCFSSITSDHFVIAKQAFPPQRGWGVRVRAATSGAIDFYIASDGNTLVLRNSSALLSAGTWYHVACVYDAGAQTMDVYVNGVVGNAGSPTIPASQYNSTNNVDVGRRPDNTQYSPAKVADLTVHDRALSVAEIWALSRPTFRWLVEDDDEPLWGEDAAGGGGSTSRPVFQHKPTKIWRRAG